MIVKDIVIVGAGIAGLATSLGLHRLGIESLILESADSLRTTGFALATWNNAWRALDAIGIAHILREKHKKLTGLVTTSVHYGVSTFELPFTAVDSTKYGDIDLRCVIRKVVLETLESELPSGTVRYSSKVVHIETHGYFKSIHLADGTIIKTKVLIGCDGVNSMVAKHLGFSSPSFVGRSAVRGFVYYEDGHGFEPKFMQFFGKGVRYGLIPCNDYALYWFFTFTPLPQEEEIGEDPTRLKQFILSKVGKVSDEIKQVFEKTQANNMVCSAMRFRHPWELVWGNISKDNICVLGDALHPMTPDLGQGGCCALEDSVILARLLGEALKGNDEEKEEHRRIKESLQQFARERKWRSIDLITSSYMVGFMQQTDGAVMQFLRDKLMPKLLAGVLLKKASFDCGSLTVS